MKKYKVTKKYPGLDIDDVVKISGKFIYDGSPHYWIYADDGQHRFCSEEKKEECFKEI